MAKGNCNSMNKLIEGKMMSAVSGVGEITAAVAKELNATSTVIYVRRAKTKCQDTHKEFHPTELA